MSAISDLRKQVEDLEARLSIAETVLAKLLDKGGVQDLSGEIKHIGEVRNPIGYKVPKRGTKR